ncbi:MAG: 4'-phosphopantetheinyl transferase superfamily protein [Schaedlerella sp.]|nr:4'-phosphopantetheinyl transferase superfamily protein [Schaedlerella sp.]
MVRVYAADISMLKDPKVCPDILNGLAEYRQNKIKAFHNSKGRIESFGAGILLQKVLSRHGKSDREITIGVHGKPELSGLYFNLSHSDTICLCVVSEKKVGCDIEKIKTAPQKLAKRFFHKNEIQYLETLDSKEQNLTFYRLWTIKESYLKMTGDGLSYPLKEFEVRFADDIKIYKGTKVQNCYVKEYYISGFKVSVCAKENIFDNTIEFIQL